MTKFYFCAFLLGSVTVGGVSAYEMPAGAEPQISGDVLRGAAIFRNECGLCHQAAEGDGEGGQGPNLRGVVGRRIGGDPDFAYSPALSAATEIWTVDRLAKFLEDPEKAFPGNGMPTNVSVAQDRADIISYLEGVTSAP